MPQFVARYPWLTLAGFIACCLVWYGWELFWFLTDDAFISFRYASNWMLGRGLVWNPEPFFPVEGYTNFLWIVLLSGVWALTGVEPPESANWLSLLFGYASLYLVLLTGWRLLPEHLSGRSRQLLLGLMLGYIVLNRTFLTWLSSGLETAMVGFFLSWWVHDMLLAPQRGSSLLVRASAASTGLALTRPDGLLFWSATLATLLVYRFQWLGCLKLKLQRPTLASFVTGLVILSVPVWHILWRFSYYDAWLPNTYYAKVTTAWPQTGLAYLVSFILEQGVYLWIVLLLCCVPLLRWRVCMRWLTRKLSALSALAAIVLHIGYYSLIAGGDLFEYRVFAYLVPLSALGLMMTLVILFSSDWTRGLVFTLFILLSLPIAWVHWWHTRDLSTRAETIALAYPVAPHFPAIFHPVVAVFDRLQSFLIGHSVCLRHQENKIFYRFQVGANDTRSSGLRRGWEERDIVLAGAVGVPGWMLPNTAIIDLFGLNDRVVARSDSMIKKGRKRKLAHERVASLPYRACFLPSRYQRISVDSWFLDYPLLQSPPEAALTQGFGQIERKQAPSDQQIRDCETRSWDRAIK